MASISYYNNTLMLSNHEHYGLTVLLADSWDSQYYLYAFTYMGMSSLLIHNIAFLCLWTKYNAPCNGFVKKSATICFCGKIRLVLIIVVVGVCLWVSLLLVLQMWWMIILLYLFGPCGFYLQYSYREWYCYNYHYYYNANNQSISNR